MTFEGLLPFILLFIMWGASRILLKMARTNQKEQDSAQKPGFIKMMQEHLATLEEQGNDEESIDSEEYFQLPSQSQADEYENESLMETTQDSLQQEPPINGRETVSVSLPPGAAKPRPAILRRKSMAMMNRRKLQNAVIWAEILAPPVALRDQ